MWLRRTTDGCTAVSCQKESSCHLLRCTVAPTPQCGSFVTTSNTERQARCLSKLKGCAGTLRSGSGGMGRGRGYQAATHGSSLSAPWSLA